MHECTNGLNAPVGRTLGIRAFLHFCIIAFEYYHANPTCVASGWRTTSRGFEASSRLLRP